MLLGIDWYGELGLQRMALDRIIEGFLVSHFFFSFLLFAYFSALHGRLDYHRWHPLTKPHSLQPHHLCACHSFFLVFRRVDIFETSLVETAVFLKAFRI